jgi:hypothetical protein
VLPLRHALDVQHIDAFAPVVKSDQQHSIVKDCRLEVCESGRQRE